MVAISTTYHLTDHDTIVEVNGLPLFHDIMISDH